MMGFEITSELIALTSILSSLTIALFTLYFGTVVQERVRIKMEKDMILWQWKEEGFFDMLSLLSSFSKEAKDFKFDGQNSFVEAYRHLWLYAPDEVIKTVNVFLFEIGYKYETYTDMERAAAELIYSMRKALFPDTKLAHKDVFLAMTIE